ncbi:MAG: hypothetical protein DMG38_03530 [Acidobacteria bacterium]|nr:MAG: hypothetical protein DMG38_03530 [Acidobacteriota bacterium]
MSRASANFSCVFHRHEPLLSRLMVAETRGQDHADKGKTKQEGVSESGAILAPRTAGEKPSPKALQA